MGMSESDVLNILGKPTSSENNYEYEDGIRRKNECWNYPRRRSPLLPSLFQ